MLREPWSDIGSLQSDVRNIQSTINGKADSHEIHEAIRKLDSLEHTVREVGTSLNELRYENERLQERIQQLEIEGDRGRS